jgi:hypothetical protein
LIKGSGKKIIEDSLNPNLFIYTDLELLEDKRDRSHELGLLCD